MRDFIKILIASALLAINISSCDKIDNTDSIDDVNNVEDTGPAIGVSKMEGWAGDYISIASAQMLKGVTFAPVTEGAIASE